MKLSFVDLAIATSQRSDCDTKVGAVLVKGSRVIRRAYNKRRTDPKVKRMGYPAHAGMHAEFALLAENYWYQDELKNATVYVGRRDKTGQLANATPCTGCQRLLRHVGVRFVVHTIPGGCSTLRLR